MHMRMGVRAVMVTAVAALGLTFGSMAAHASTALSGTATGIWGATDSAARSNAENSAVGNMLSSARALGESTCINITYSDTLVYVVPSGGGSVYNSTATGVCGNVVFTAGRTMSGTSPQTWATTYGAAEQAAESNALGTLLTAARGVGYWTCVNVTYADTLVYAVPSNGGDVFVSTATGLCGTQTFQ